MLFIKLSKLERKRFAIFVLCLICAMSTWFFMALNNKYLYSVNTRLIYKNEPYGKAFKALQPDTVQLKVEGTGWQLLFARLRINPPAIEVSLKPLNSRSFVLLSEQLNQINEQLETSHKVKSIYPDTLFFDFSKRFSKKVPVKLVSDLSFARQYGISNQIKLTPTYINISGSQEELEKIKDWETDTLKLKNVVSSVSSYLNFKKNIKSNVGVYPNRVGVYVPVDEFTEKTLTIPVSIINNQEYNDVKLYPKKVKVTFMVALSSYTQFDEDFIEAFVDLNEWKIMKHQKLNVKFSLFSEYCKLVKTEPDKLDFIVNK